MGQCQYCRGVKDDPAQVTAGNGNPLGRGEDFGAKNSGSDSALDSEQSGDEGGCSAVHVALRLTRSGPSSQSFEKYSLRGSYSSFGDFERHEYPSASANEDDDDDEEGEVLEVSFDDQNQATSSLDICEGHLRPLQDVEKWRKLSRGSNEGNRGSMTSMTSLTSELRAKVGRSISLKSSPRGNGILTSPGKGSSLSPKKPRSVSLKLPRRKKRPRNFQTKLPTIYVDDTEVPPLQDTKQKMSRKMTLRRTFSLLNMNSLNRQDSKDSKQTQQPQGSQKPVQKILRQPRRRHNTVRGVSGMAIDGSNRTGIHSTRYYPTNTSLRVATPASSLYL